jgi:hypothetical protein
MNKLTYFIGLLVTLVFSACSHYCCDAPRPDNFMNAQRNNETWTAVANGIRLTGDTLNIIGIGVNAGSNLHDTLAFKIKYTTPGNYKPTLNQVSYHSTIGNGSPLSTYKLDTLFSNSITVTGYNETTNRLTGTFALKFADPANSGSISFLYGNFKVALN